MLMPCRCSSLSSCTFRPLGKFRNLLRAESVPVYHLQLVITDGCPGLARALETVYPRARHQRCWVHKMRNILEKVRRRDEKQVKRQAQKQYPTMVRQLERDLPELLHCCAFPRHLWRKLRTTNIIERCFVEVRRRTRPMVVFTNVESWTGLSMRFSVVSTRTGKNHTLELFTQAA